MTSFLDTEYIIVVTVGGTHTVHRLVPVPEWRPQLIDIADRRTSLDRTLREPVWSRSCLALARRPSIRWPIRRMGEIVCK